MLQRNKLRSFFWRGLYLGFNGPVYLINVEVGRLFSVTIWEKKS